MFILFVLIIFLWPFVNTFIFLNRTLVTNDRIKNNIVIIALYRIKISLTIEKQKQSILIIVKQLNSNNIVTYNAALKKTNLLSKFVFFIKKQFNIVIKFI